MRYLILSILFVGCSIQTTEPTEQPQTPVKAVHKDTLTFPIDSLHNVIRQGLKGATVKDTAPCEDRVNYLITLANRGENIASLLELIPESCIER